MAVNGEHLCVVVYYDKRRTEIFKGNLVAAFCGDDASARHSSACFCFHFQSHGGVVDDDNGRHLRGCGCGFVSARGCRRALGLRERERERERETRTERKGGRVRGRDEKELDIIETRTERGRLVYVNNAEKKKRKRN